MNGYGRAWLSVRRFLTAIRVCLAIVACPLSATITVWSVAAGFCVVVSYFIHSQDVDSAFTRRSMLGGEGINALATECPVGILLEMTSRSNADVLSALRSPGS
jgi:hypothetical protein